MRHFAQKLPLFVLPTTTTRSLQPFQLFLQCQIGTLQRFRGHIMQDPDMFQHVIFVHSFPSNPFTFDGRLQTSKVMLVVLGIQVRRIVQCVGIELGLQLKIFLMALTSRHALFLKIEF